VTEHGSLLAPFKRKCSKAGWRKRGKKSGALRSARRGRRAGCEEKRYAQDAVVALVQLAAPAGTTRTSASRRRDRSPCSRTRAATRSSGAPDRSAHFRCFIVLKTISERAVRCRRQPDRNARCRRIACGPASVAARASDAYCERSVYIGNAAQTLHPVAGQGLNLGLRDAWDLAQILREGRDPGGAATLARYAASRRLDAQATIRVTDLLAGAFLGSGRLGRAARGVLFSCGAHLARHFSRAAALFCAPHDLWTFRAALKTKMLLTRFFFGAKRIESASLIFVRATPSRGNENRSARPAQWIVCRSDGGHHRSPFESFSRSRSRRREAAREMSRKAIGDARHRSDKQSTVQDVRSDSHCRGLALHERK